MLLLILKIMNAKTKIQIKICALIINQSKKKLYTNRITADWTTS
jgi:hypothetical protein